MSKKNKKPKFSVLETLSTHIKRIEKYQPLLAKKKIIISTELDVTPFDEDGGVKKTPVVWSLIDYKMFYIVEVPSGATIAKHSHDEAIFRILISGSLILNGITIDKPGTWYVVPAFTEYEIVSKEGYTVFSGYGMACQTRVDDAIGRKNSSNK